MGSHMFGIWIFYFIKFNRCVNSCQDDVIKRLYTRRIKEIYEVGIAKITQFSPNVTRMGSIVIGQRIAYNGVGVLGGQQPIPSKN